MNIVYIVSDTFRRDHLGLYGNKTIRTPHLDRFGQKRVVFDKCYACSFPTMPMRADIFTGKWTSTYLGWNPLPQDEVVLAEVLRKAGYLTKAVVDTPFFVKTGYNYDRGFKDFELVRGQGTGHIDEERRDINLQRRYETDYCAPATMLSASRWLERHYKEKFFLYVDTWDPHEPWNPPPWYTELYYPNYEWKGYLEERHPSYWTWKDGVDNTLPKEAERQLMTEEKLKIAHACYCREVTMVDRWVGYLLENIEAMNLMDKTVIIFTSDHGFYFGEHGYFGKGMHKAGKWYRSPLYEEITRVPLLMHVPGTKAQRAKALVSVVDLMPTVLELAGLEIPATVQSRSLVPALEGKPTEQDFVVSSWPLYRLGEVTKAKDHYERRITEPFPSTITTHEWTLLYAQEGYPAELYHLPSDPKQEKNIIAEVPETARALLGKFVSRLEEAAIEPSLLNSRRRF